MAATMIVYMNITSTEWTTEYFEKVPKILAEYGAVSIAGGYHVQCLEGVSPPPDRMAVFSFPSMSAAARCLEDERYQRFKMSRQNGSNASIFIFDNLVTDPAAIV